MIVVVTGGTAGVGRATARAFAAAGDDVAILARGAERLAATAHELRAAGVRALPIRCDVSDADAVTAAAAQIERELGPIDVWINNAMVTVVGAVAQVTPDELRRVTDVCYHGTVWGTRAALACMRPRGRGAILQVGSALAYRSIPLQAAYCAAKHAIAGFTDSLRSELLHDRVPIALCMVQLPAVNTPQFDWCVNHTGHACQPVPPIFQPEVIARALVTLSRHPRREVFLGGSAIQAIVGTRVAAGYADRVLAHRGYSGQLLDEPSPRGPTNLFAPVGGDPGAHGRFDARARAHDAVARIATWLGASATQAVLAAGVVGAALGLGAALRLLARRAASR